MIATNSYFPTEQFLLLDGLPRTLQQADFIESHVEVKQIISLEMPNIERLIARIKRRAVIERRTDDFDEKILRNRMQVYKNETVKLLGRYPKSLVSTFNADQPPLDVLRDVLIKLSFLLTHSRLG